MDPSRRRRMSLTVSFKPAHLFLNSLMAMRTMASSAVLNVKNREIQILATSRDLKAKSSLVMEASTASSLPSNRYAIRFDLSTWTQLLSNRILQQLSGTVTLFKVAESSDLQCTVGNETVPFKLDEANFVQSNAIDIDMLMAHPVSVTLATECFRQVLATCASKFDTALMRVFEDKVSFHIISNMLTFTTEDGECMVLGVQPRTISYIFVEWRIPRTLDNASGLTKDVMICPLTDAMWMDWILFSFRLDLKNFFACMIYGAGVHIVF